MEVGFYFQRNKIKIKDGSTLSNQMVHKYTVESQTNITHDGNKPKTKCVRPFLHSGIKSGTLFKMTVIGDVNKKQVTQSGLCQF